MSGSERLYCNYTDSVCERLFQISFVIWLMVLVLIQKNDSLNFVQKSDIAITAEMTKCIMKPPPPTQQHLLFKLTTFPFKRKYAMS